MKKIIFIYSVLINALVISGCVVDPGSETVYRRQITIESNLSKFQIGYRVFDSTTVYPYILQEITDTHLNTGNVFLQYTLFRIRDL